MSDRCHRCDRPKATRDDHDRYRGGEGEHLCWGGTCPEVDWRARALAAEERLATMVQQGNNVDVGGGSGSTAAPFNVGDWVRARPAGYATECVFQVAEVVEIDQTWGIRGETASGAPISAWSRDCTMTTPTPPTDPLARFASLIADAERAVDGPATEQAKCIAAMAKALRESQAQGEEAKRTLRSIVELAR